MRTKFSVSTSDPNSLAEVEDELVSDVLPFLALPFPLDKSEPQMRRARTSFHGVA